MINKKELIKKIELFANLLDFHGANKFKVNAFKNAANILRRFGGDLANEVAEGTLEKIKGIGKGIASFIYEYAENNGKIKELEELLHKTPSGILEILKIRGLGIGKVKQIYESLQIDNLADLEAKCRTGELQQLKGFSEKSVQKVIDEIEKIKSSRSKLLLHRAFELSAEIKELLNDSLLFILIEPAGELRRIREIINQIDFVCLLNYEADSKKKLVNYLKINKIDCEISSNSLLLKNFPVPIFLHFADNEKEFSEIVERLSCAPEFIAEIENAGNFGVSESDIFNGENYIIPEMREQEYFSLRENLRTSSDLNIDDIQGLLHFHTNYSDGINTLEEMIRGAEELGFRYAVVCDHSKSAFYANGLNENRVLQQKEYVKEIAKASPLPVLLGIESDILNDGSLDYSDDFLVEFSFVVASIHSNFTMNEKEMTNRIIKAIENPFTDLLAHPTGRLLLSRDPYKLNIKKVIDACAENDVAIEINANPNRLDLDWRNIYYAREKGVKLAINADAHSIEDLNYTLLGIKIARKAGVRKSEVINYYSFEEFIKFINRKVKREVNYGS